MEHPPRLWKAQDTGNRIYIIEAGSGARIATLCEGWPNPDIEANARLIATAPELLEVLKEARRKYRLVRSQIFGTDAHEEMLLAVIDKATDV